MSCWASPVSSEVLPSPDAIALPHERVLLTTSLLPLFSNTELSREQRLGLLDGALAKLGQPTRLRGLVQLMRASILAEGAGDKRAHSAVDESIRLLPTYSGPLLVAAGIYAYSDQPGKAADFLMRASRIDPEVVSKIPEFEIDNIVRRLNVTRDDRRVLLLSERLLAIGWTGDSLAGQSKLARRGIEARVAAGEIEEAKALVPKLLDPGDALSLLAQYTYRPLWPDIDRWAGPRLEKQWHVYLTETREAWKASRDPASARAYLRALASAGHDETAVRELLPLFDAKLDPRRDYELLYVAAPLAAALARTGRWDAIETMYRNALAAWPPGRDANALNLDANRAVYLLRRGNAAQALLVMDRAIAEAARWKDQINADAVAAMHQERACILHALGQDDLSLQSRAMALNLQGPTSRADLYLCLNRPEDARDTLIAALENESERDDVIDYVQPNGKPPMQSAYSRTIHSREQALRSDPKLLAAVARYGRVLPFGMDAGAPAEATR